MTESVDKMTDRAVGSVVGLATGDALGSTVEFMSAAEIISRYGPRGHTEMRGGGSFGWEVGEYTDDGQTMMCLLESLVETNSEKLVGLDVHDLGRRLLAWFEAEPKDIGITTRNSLLRLRTGIPADQSGDDNPESQANGAVMRCAPVSVLWHRPEHRVELLRDSRLSAAPTHRSRIAWGACPVVNVMIAEFINGSNFDTALNAAIEGANDAWQPILTQWNEAGRPRHNNSGWAIATVLTSLNCLYTTDSFEDAVIKAVNGGDDADTVGAVTGQLAGAFYGYASIPERWVDVLKDQYKLITLTKSLFKLAEPD